MSSLLAVHAAATWFMVGLIWTVQSVHYPLFHDVGAAGFVAYERGHTRRIGRLLVFPAALEVVTAGLVFTTDPSPLTFTAGALLAGIWGMTALVHGPIHGRLDAGYEKRLVTRLVRANWWRTGAWTARGGLALALLLAS